MVKKIHCCWFGGTIPDSVKRNLEEWEKLNPDFDICLYHEDNIDVEAYEFGRRAKNAKRWGFLVDIIRPQKLVEQGGFYLDADIELIRPLSCLESDGDKLIMGYMYGCALGTAALYSPPNHPYMVDILEKYNNIALDFWPVSNSIFTEYFINSVPGFLLNGKEWSNDICHIHEKEFFEQPALIRSHGVSIHHCCGSWSKKSNGAFGVSLTISAFAHLKKWAARKYRTASACRRNEFYDVYKAALAGLSVKFDASRYYEQAPR